MSHGDVTFLVSIFTAVDFSLRIAFFESFNFLRSIYLFMVALCLGCCLSAFSNFRAQGLLWDKVLLWLWKNRFWTAPQQAVRWPQNNWGSWAKDSARPLLFTAKHVGEGIPDRCHQDTWVLNISEKAGQEEGVCMGGGLLGRQWSQFQWKET